MYDMCVGLPVHCIYGMIVVDIFEMYILVLHFDHLTLIYVAAALFAGTTLVVIAIYYCVSYIMHMTVRNKSI